MTEKQAAGATKAFKKNIEWLREGDGFIVTGVLGEATMELLKAGTPITKQVLQTWIDHQDSRMPHESPDSALRKAVLDGARKWLDSLPDCSTR